MLGDVRSFVIPLRTSAINDQRVLGLQIVCFSYPFWVGQTLLLMYNIIPKNEKNQITSIRTLIILLLKIDDIDSIICTTD